MTDRTRNHSISNHPHGCDAVPSPTGVIQTTLGPSDSSCSNSAWVPTSHFTNTRFNTVFAVLCEMPPVPAANCSDCPTYSALTSRASAAVSP